MSTPRFPANPFTDIVPRRGATSSKAGPDTYRRLANVEQALGANASVDVDALNMMRAMNADLIGWAYDPMTIIDTADYRSTLASGSTYITAIYVPAPATVTGILNYTTVAGVGTWTIGKAGIYSIDGTLLRSSANSFSRWKATGITEIPLTSTVFLDRGIYYAAMLNVRSTTMTAPSIAGQAGFSTLMNVRTASGIPRFGVGTGKTDLTTGENFSTYSLSTNARWAAFY